jgi:hypothetical protein
MNQAIDRDPAGEVHSFPAGGVTLAFRVSLDQYRQVEQFCFQKAISSGKTVSRSDGCRELLDTALRWFPRGRT